MLALYRCGRQAEALEAYREARRVLVDEIGVEPGPELRRLQEAILRQDAVARAGSCRRRAAARARRRCGAAARRARRRARLAARALGAGARAAPAPLVTVLGERGIGKTPPGGRAGRRGPPAGAAVRLRRGRRARRRRARARWPRSRGARARRCWSSTTPTAPATTSARGARATLRGRRRRSRCCWCSAGDDDSDALARFGADGSLVLQPLDVEAVRAIAGALRARVAPTRTCPAEWLLDASGGVPAPRARARGRVGAARGGAAGRSAPPSGPRPGAPSCARSRTSWPAASSSCRPRASASTLVADARERRWCARSRASRPSTSPTRRTSSGASSSSPSSWRGSVGAPLLGVVGPSGSGKSSVVRAGLLPALAGGVLPGSEQLGAGARPPRRAPDARAARRRSPALGDRADGARRRPVRGDLHGLPRRGRARGVRRRARARGARPAPAVRRGARDPRRLLRPLRGLPGAVERCSAANHVLVGADAAATSCAGRSSCPAQRAGLRVEPELTDALVADVEDEPGALPLLSTALLELWQRRDGRRLRHADYERTGGVRGAVARLAEGAFERLDAAQQADRARASCCAWPARAPRARSCAGASRSPSSRPSDDEAAGVVDAARRRAPAHDQRGIGRGRARGAAARVAAPARLDRGGPRGPADPSQAHRRRRGVGPTGPRRRRALPRHPPHRGARVARRPRPALNPLEREFLDASDARRQRERAARRRRIELAFAALAAALAAISVVAVVAIHQGREANETARHRGIARARGQGDEPARRRSRAQRGACPVGAAAA